MINRGKILLYNEAPTKVFSAEMSLPPSGSVFTDAGWRENDSNPTSGSLYLGSGSFFDGDKETAVTPDDISTNYSIGISIADARFLQSITFYDSGSRPGWYISGSNATIDAYSSSSNKYWGLCATFVHPSRTLYSGSTIYKTTLNFNPVIYGTNIKLHMVDGPLKDPSGNILRITGIETEERPQTTSSSGSLYHEYGPTPENSAPTNVTEIEIRPSGA